MRHGLLFIVLATAGGGSLSAQYARRPADTLRFREVTISQATFESPQGLLQMDSEHDAIIALVFGRADSARAWYQSLRIAAASPAGRQEPSTAAALGKPFVLRFDARGRIATLAVPEFPASFKGITDLSHQFDDYFLRLPAKALALGTVWADTLVLSKANGPSTSRSEQRASYRVERDTVVAGVRAYVVSMRQDLALEGSEPVQGQQQLTATTSLKGSDEGIFVFAPTPGALLGRRRTGTLAGSVTYVGGPAPIKIPYRLSYTNTITSLAASR